MATVNVATRPFRAFFDVHFRLILTVHYFEGRPNLLPLSCGRQRHVAWMLTAQLTRLRSSSGLAILTTTKKKHCDFKSIDRFKVRHCTSGCWVSIKAVVFYAAIGNRSAAVLGSLVETLFMQRQRPPADAGRSGPATSYLFNHKSVHMAKTNKIQIYKQTHVLWILL